MWVAEAAGSACFAGLVAVLAKLGLGKINSTLATAIRTIVVLLFSVLMTTMTQGWQDIGRLDGWSCLILVLSGLATGGSWLCYFKALANGPVAQVAAIDKSSVILTIGLSFLWLHEPCTFQTFIGLVLIGAGTFLMMENHPLDKAGRTPAGSWVFYALGSAGFAALSAILGKLGIVGINSNLGTTIRTLVVLCMAWMMVGIQKSFVPFSRLSMRDLFFLIASGLATGASWLLYYRALQTGPASAIVPIDKLSILVTIFFSVIVLHERPCPRVWLGLCVLCIGTILMVI